MSAKARRARRASSMPTAADLAPPTRPVPAPTPPLPIRTATPDDIDDVMALLRLMHHENGRGPLDEAKVRAAVLRGAHKQRAFIGIIGEPGVPQATIGLFVESFWYTQAEHLNDLWNFVHPGFRRSSHARDLIEWAKAWSDNLGIPLGMGIMSIDRVWEKVELYERRLGPPVGAAFWHEPQPVAVQ